MTIANQLSKSQLAMIAVKMLAPLKEEAKKRQVAAGVRGVEGGRGHEKTLPPDSAEGFIEPRNRRATEAVQQAAKLVGVGKTVVRDARVPS